MPTLRLFGQRTPVAGDDLRIYSLLFLLLRLSQLGVSIVLLAYTADILDNQENFYSLYSDAVDQGIYTPLLNELEENLLECMESRGEGDTSRDRVVRMNHSYLILTIILSCAGILFAHIIFYVTSRGTPTNGHITNIALPGGSPQRQRKEILQAFCHVHLTILAALRLAAAWLGIQVFYELVNLCHCYKEVDADAAVNEWNAQHPENPAVLEANIDLGCQGTVHELYYFLMVTHNLELLSNLVVIGLAASSAFCGTTAWKFISKKLFIPRVLGSEGRWRLFCRCCCTLTSVASCFLLGGREAALGDFTEIAMLLADFFDFHGTLDVTATDMVTALLLLGQVQAQRVRDCRRDILEKTHDYKSNRVLKSNYQEVKEEGPCTDSIHTEISESDFPGDNLSMRRVLKKVSMSNSFVGIHYQLKRYSGAGDYKWEAQVTKLLDPLDCRDMLVIAEGARFMRLSMAIYTWVMFSINRPCTGCCTICCVSVGRDCAGERPEQPYYGEGHYCRLHSTAFLREAGIDDESEVVYAYFHSGVVETPHAVVLDHEWKSVVIVIRGTLSLEDILTDLTIKPTSLEDAGNEYGFDGSDIHVHGGVLASSEWILKGLREKRILEKLFAPESHYAGYQLRVTGHSLGAGIAAITAMMLRPTYPKIKCHSFSPPGCTMSENAAKDCEEFITSYILDADIIPRASLTSLENLRLDLVEIVSRIKVPKHEAMAEFTGCNLWGRKDKSTIVERVLYREDETPRSSFTDSWRKYRQLYDAKKMERSIGLMVELFPPGKLVQMFPSEGEDVAGVATRESCPLNCFGGNNEQTFTTRYANRHDFREIRISSHFVDDHIPLAVLTRLEGEAERFGLAPPYLVEVHSESSTHPEEEQCEPAVIKAHSIFAGFFDGDADEAGAEEAIEVTYQ